MAKIGTGILVALLAAGQAWAEPSNQYRLEWQGDIQYEDPTPWKEGTVELPPYPKEGDLLEVPLDRKGYDFFIDTKHLSLGDDGVTRYTLVIRSSSGARNVFFEGIRCVTQAYRGYGYGSSDGKIHPLNQSDWRAVRDADTFGFRYELARFFFCDPSTMPFNEKQVIDRIEHADDEDYATESSSIFD